MTKSLRKVVALTLLSSLTAFAGTGLAQRNRERFEETTSVVVVQVPLQVTVDGEPLKGLTAENFEILDGRKKRDITGFEAYDLSMTSSEQGQATAAFEVPSSARRHFLLLFDLSFSNVDSVSRARSAARDLVRDSLHPSDLVAVATYSVSGGARLVLGFTPDRDQVEVAIRTLGLINPAERIRDPLNLQYAELSESLANTFRFDEETGPSDDSGTSRFDADQEWSEQIRELSILSGKATRDSQVQQVTALTNSMQDLARMLASVQGRKHVLYLSEGFDSSIMLGNAGSTVAEQNRITRMNQAAERGIYQEVDSVERFGDNVALSAMNDMVEQLRRADCTVQSIDIGGLRAGSDARGGGSTGSADASTSARGEQGLFYLANETGGDLYRNFNDLGDAMEEMLERTSSTYVLSFQPPKLAMDGSFRQIKVKLKDVPKGARVTHRPGYFAPKPFSQQSPMERTLLSAGIVMGGAIGGPIHLDVLAAPFRSGGATAYVPVLIEIDGPDLLAGQTQGSIPAEIYGYAIGQDGKIADFFSQTVGLDLGRVGGALSQSGFKFWGDFELEPGAYTLRVLVRNSSTGDFSLSSTPVEVPEFSARQALLQPFFPEEPGKWLLGKESSSQAQAEYDYPFLLQGNSFIPAAKPEIPVGRSTTVSLVGYNLGSGVEMEALLSNLDGTEVGKYPLTLASEASASGTQRWLGRFKTAADVDAGDYVLELVGSGASGSPLRSAPISVSILR